MTENDQNTLVPIEHIAQAILVLRGQKVLLDSDLAAIYGIETQRFNEQVRRNLARFPADFMLRTGRFKVAICDLKHESRVRWTTLRTNTSGVATHWRFHRARSDQAQGKQATTSR